MVKKGFLEVDQAEELRAIAKEIGFMDKNMKNFNMTTRGAVNALNNLVGSFKGKTSGRDYFRDSAKLFRDLGLGAKLTREKFIEVAKAWKLFQEGLGVKFRTPRHLYEFMENLKKTSESLNANLHLTGTWSEVLGGVYRDAMNKASKSMGDLNKESNELAKRTEELQDVIMGFFKEVEEGGKKVPKWVPPGTVEEIKAAQIEFEGLEKRIGEVNEAYSKQQAIVAEKQFEYKESILAEKEIEAKLLPESLKPPPSPTSPEAEAIRSAAFTAKQKYGQLLPPTPGMDYGVVTGDVSLTTGMPLTEKWSRGPPGIKLPSTMEPPTYPYGWQKPEGIIRPSEAIGKFVEPEFGRQRGGPEGLAGIPELATVVSEYRKALTNMEQTEILGKFGKWSEKERLESTLGKKKEIHIADLEGGTFEFLDYFLDLTERFNKIKEGFGKLVRGEELVGTGMEIGGEEVMQSKPKGGRKRDIFGSAFGEYSGFAAVKEKFGEVRGKVKEMGVLGTAGAIAGAGAKKGGEMLWKGVKHLGKKGVQKTFKAIGEVGKVFKSGATAPFTALVGMIKGLAGAFQPFQIILEPLTEIVGTLGSIMGAQLAPALGDLIKAFINEDTIQMVTNIGAAFLPIVEAFTNILESEGVQTIMEQVSELFVRLGPIFETVLGAFQPFIDAIAESGIIESLGDVFVSIGGFIAGIFSNPGVQQAMSTLMGVLGEVFDVIADIFADPAIQQMVADIVISLTNIVTDVFEVLKPILPPIITALVWVVRGFTWIMEAIVGFVKFVTLGLVDMSSDVPSEPDTSLPQSLQKQGIIVRSGLAEVHAGEAVVKKELISEIFKEMTVNNNFYGTPDHFVREDFSRRMDRLWN